MFRIFEKERSRFGITDYSVSETTLEQIFIHFAKQQEMLDEKVYEQVGMQAEPQSPAALGHQDAVYVNLSAQLTTPAVATPAIESPPVESSPEGEGVSNLVEVRPAGSSASVSD